MRLSKICDELKLEFIGDDREISGLQTLDGATKDNIVYFENEKLLELLKNTKAGAVIISNKFKEFVPVNCSIVFSENPHLSMAYISKIFAPSIINQNNKQPQIGQSALVMLNVYIGNGSVIKDNVTLMPGVYVGENVIIEEGTLIHPNVVIYNDTKIGKNCTILANSTIGSDGFGYAHTKTGEHIKIYHTGNVILEDNVEIGANTTVDRAVFGSTIIKKGTKVDNLVQIGHNCELGENTILVSQVGLSGSTKTGRNVVMGGQSGSAGHLKIGDFATVASRGGVTKSIEGNKIYSGNPCMPHKDSLKLKAKMIKFFLKDNK